MFPTLARGEPPPVKQTPGPRNPFPGGHANGKRL
jgi:hypothetical protein